MDELFSEACFTASLWAAGWCGTLRAPPIWNAQNHPTEMFSETASGVLLVLLGSSLRQL